MIDVVMMSVATLFLAYSFTQGDPEWHSECGQEHHPLGEGLLAYAILVAIISVLAVAVTGMVGGNSEWVPMYLVTAGGAFLQGRWLEMLR